MGIRLNKVLTELNIGLQTAVEFLKTKTSLGEIRDDATQNTKITDARYEALVEEFSGDKAVKTQAATLFPKKPKKPELAKTKTEERMAQRQQFTPLGKIDLSTIGKPKPAAPAPAPAKPVSTEPKKEEVAQPKKEETKPQPEATAVSPEKVVVEEKKEVKPAEESVVEVKKPEVKEEKKTETVAPQPEVVDETPETPEEDNAPEIYKTNPTALPQLVEQWFLVPQSHDDRLLSRQITDVARMLEKSSDAITHYTILPTTDCNARCFYCYEKGRRRIPMTDRTAQKVADLQSKYDRNEVYLQHLLQVMDENSLDTMGPAPQGGVVTADGKSLEEATEPSESEMALREEAGDLLAAVNSRQQNDGVSISARADIQNLFLQPPTTGTIVTAYNVPKNQYGIDVANREGTLVTSAAEGMVVFAGYDVTDGNVIIIQHHDNVLTIYKNNQVLLKSKGAKVAAGEPIARMGHSGITNKGNHLHFELWHNGFPLNPLDYLTLK